MNTRTLLLALLLIPAAATAADDPRASVAPKFDLRLETEVRVLAEGYAASFEAAVGPLPTQRPRPS